MSGGGAIAENRRKTEESLHTDREIAALSGEIAGKYPGEWAQVEGALESLVYPHEKLDLLYKLSAASSLEERQQLVAAANSDELQRYQLFEPLAEDEYQALKADIRERGVMVPVEKDEQGNILDGHHRVRAWHELRAEGVALPPYPVLIRAGWSEAEKRKHVRMLNFARRHLTRAQRDAQIVEMRKEGMSYRAIAEVVGVDHKTAMNVVKSTGENSPVDDLPDRITGRDGKSRPATKPTIYSSSATADLDARRAAEVLEAVQEDPDAFGDLAGKLDTSSSTNRARKELHKRKREAVQPAPLSSPCSPRLFVGRAEALPLASESIGLIITSPPYNLGGSRWQMGWDREPRRGVGYGDAMSEGDYQNWQLAVLRELYRVAEPGASLFYNHKVRQRAGEIIHPLDWLRNDLNPWLLRQEIVWDRLSTHNHEPTLFWPHDERIYWLTKGKPALPDRSIGMPTVWRFHGPKPGTWHPAPFPEALPRRCLQAVGRPGVTVLDPFAGSCTTLKVALELGYDVIGVDVSAEYLERARRENGWTTTPIFA
jgi:DNA modification methylase/ParB-like chromosome segregation protein Spo0J